MLRNLLTLLRSYSHLTVILSNDLLIFSDRQHYKTMLLALFLAILIQRTENYKILVNIPRFGHSHVEFMGRLADVLVEAGHDVVFF